MRKNSDLLIAAAEKLALMRSHFLAEMKVRVEAEEYIAWVIMEK